MLAFHILTPFIYITLDYDGLELECTLVANSKLRFCYLVMH
jgi:hypothetical protein